MSLLEHLTKALGWRIQRLQDQFRQWRMKRMYQGKTAEDVFTHIYTHGLWGGDANHPFFSGVGSHDERVVSAYVSAVGGWLKSLPNPPQVVDLGCGDFNVGQNLRGYCGRYVACDVVPALVASNAERYAHLGVDFRHLDITADALPEGDVVFIRQVLQHLCNDQISRVVAKLGQYRYVVLTEHLPGAPGFTPNLDKPTGHGIRVGRNPPSAVVLTASPFNFTPAQARVLLEVPSEGGVVQTVLYSTG